MRLPSSRLCREVISLSSRHLPLRCPASAVAARPTSLLLTRSLFATSKRSTRFFSTQLAEAASPFPSTASGPVGPISFSPPPSSSPSSSAPSPSPSSSSRQLPYDVHSAKAVAETIPSPISAADEGEACPMILQQVEEDYTLPHPLWKADEVNAVSVTHRVTESVLDTLAYWTIKTIRFNFDIVSGWVFGVPTKEKALSRIIFLESVAGVPGSVASTLRHLASLRRLKRDYGWIHTLLEEAENERMSDNRPQPPRTLHSDTSPFPCADFAARCAAVAVCRHLLTFLELKQPGKFMRFSVFMSQGSPPTRTPPNSLSLSHP